MIGTSFYEYVFIRTCIFLLQYATPLCLCAVILIVATDGRSAVFAPVNYCLILYSVIDMLYAVFIWRPYNKRLRDEARHPPPLDPNARRALFHKCISHIPDFERYLSLWFLGADEAEIRRDNVLDFILWAFFDTSSADASSEQIAEAENYIAIFEQHLGRKLQPGKGNARGLCLTLDAVEIRYRSFVWYIIVGVVDFFAHCQLAWNGFRYHAQPRSKTFSIIPPKWQSIFARRRSPSQELGYWCRPHTASNKAPVVFLHGIGVGLWTYVPFLARLNKSEECGDIGVIAIELLPVSFRLTDNPLSKLEFLSQLDTILRSHGWDRFVLVTHSYGSVLASHMIHSQTFNSRIQSIVLLDPVSILLHLPDVAYNFTRRKPRRANEWQLWYFASMDPGVAHTLGRHFFWRENIVWKEELLEYFCDGETDASLTTSTRKVAVCLAERDLIVDTLTVAEHLADGENWVPGKEATRPGMESSELPETQNYHRTRRGIEVLWFPNLDHSQMFDRRRDQERICQIVRQYSRRA